MTIDDCLTPDLPTNLFDLAPNDLDFWATTNLQEKITHAKTSCPTDNRLRGQVTLVTSPNKVTICFALEFLGIKDVKTKYICLEGTSSSGQKMLRFITTEGIKPFLSGTKVPRMKNGKLVATLVDCAFELCKNRQCTIVYESPGVIRIIREIK